MFRIRYVGVFMYPCVAKEVPGISPVSVGHVCALLQPCKGRERVVVRLEEGSNGGRLAKIGQPEAFSLKVEKRLIRTAYHKRLHPLLSENERNVGTEERTSTLS